MSDWVLKPVSCPDWGALTLGGGVGWVMIGPVVEGGGGGVLPPGLRWALAGAAAREQASASSPKATLKRAGDPKP